MTETFTVIISETERYEYMVAKRGKGWHGEAGCGTAWQRTVWPGKAGVAWLGESW